MNNWIQNCYLKRCQSLKTLLGEIIMLQEMKKIPILGNCRTSNSTMICNSY